MTRNLFLTALAVGLICAATPSGSAHAQTLSIGRGGVQYNGYGRGYYGGYGPGYYGPGPGSYGPGPGYYGRGYGYGGY